MNWVYPATAGFLGNHLKSAENWVLREDEQGFYSFFSTLRNHQIWQKFGQKRKALYPFLHATYKTRNLEDFVFDPPLPCTMYVLIQV